MVVIGVGIAWIVANLVIIRLDLQWFIDKERAQQYIELPTDAFSKLAVDGHWEVRIKQGREHKVEVAGINGLHNMVNTDGTLHFVADTANAGGIQKARVTVPSLTYLSAHGYSTIRMDAYTIDTMYVSMHNGTKLIGKNNNIKFFSLNTFGEVAVELSDDGLN